MESYYSVLGVPTDASFQQIAIAFRKLALTYHPEKHPDRLAQINYKFIQICEAFEVLSTGKLFARDFAISFLSLRNRFEF